MPLRCHFCWTVELRQCISQAARQMVLSGKCRRCYRFCAGIKQMTQPPCARGRKEGRKPRAHCVLCCAAGTVVSAVAFASLRSRALPMLTLSVQWHALEQIRATMVSTRLCALRSAGRHALGNGTLLASGCAAVSYPDMRGPAPDARFPGFPDLGVV